jgi:galactose mutarotase-like enzyme
MAARTLRDVRVHDQPGVELASADIRLVIVPAQGGRVVSLEDRRSGREWLVQDLAPDSPDGSGSWAGSDAVFGGERAFGWDECLPTLAPCRDPLEPAGPPLRDHGDGWGRPVVVEPVPAEATGKVSAVRIAWTIPGRYRFERVLRLDGPTIRSVYRLASLGPDLPFLWSMHPLLSLDVGARLVIGGVDGVTVASATGLDLATRGGLAGWPVAELLAGGTIDLSEIRGVETAIALKAYADAATVPAIAYQPDGAGLAIDWDRRVAPALGVWIDAGGWPVGEGRHQVALEPTTAPFDDLAAALAAGRAAWVRPGRDVGWWTTMRLVGSRTAPSSR